MGDFTGDGGDDLGGVGTSIGTLYLYKGHGGGAIDGGSSRTEIGSAGWKGISDHVGGDFTGGGTGDLAALESQPGATGKPYLCKVNSTGGLNARIDIGTGGW
ncbi:hypothetical protein [Streptomyces sp. NBC_01320]|uniref:hypothetical protein n=1 Tax=Streptomyces sp. NBC_01320 TaxID=2903824 RepID=UPI002E109C85|nr:hypothetical protein OG395_36075 [Streptomyces sp. NBC_01320]